LWLYLIHERVDDRVSDVVGEVQIEDDDVVWNEVEDHEERRQKRDDEDDRHDEQHDGCLEVRHQNSFRLRLRRFLLLRTRFRTLLHAIVLYCRQSPPPTEQKKVKVKTSHTRYRALGPELIPVYRQSASR